jgi:UDP-GlcNAc3NAcA epimerase
VIPPLGYFEFLRSIYSSSKVLTDSGGVQKQAYFLSKPCITLRPTTEWIETVHDNWNILVDDNEQQIIHAIETFQPKKQPRLSRFGDGHTAEKIINILVKHA